MKTTFYNISTSKVEFISEDTWAQFIQTDNILDFSKNKDKPNALFKVTKVIFDINPDTVEITDKVVYIKPIS